MVTTHVSLDFPLVGSVESRGSLENEVLRIDRQNFSVVAVMVKPGTIRKDYHLGLPQYLKTGNFKGLSLIPLEERMFIAFVLGIVDDQGTQRLAYATSGTPPTHYEPREPVDNFYPTVGFPVISTIRLEDIMAFKELESREVIDKVYTLKRVD